MGQSVHFKTLRIDPISDAKPFLISRAEILSKDKLVVWKWNSANAENEIFGARLLKQFGSDGCLFGAIGTDPQWLPSIPQDVMQQIGAGWVFRFWLKTDEPLFRFCNKELISKLLAENKEIAQHNDQIEVYKLKVVELNNQINNLYNSKSWRLSRPLREISLLQSRIKKLGFLYQKYSHLYPGVTGHAKLVYKCFKTIWAGGVSGLRNKVSYYENSHKQSSLNPQIFTTHKVLRTGYLMEYIFSHYTVIDQM